MDESMTERMGGWVTKWMDGWMDGRTDGWMDELALLCRATSSLGDLFAEVRFLSATFL